MAPRNSHKRSLSEEASPPPSAYETPTKKRAKATSSPSSTPAGNRVASSSSSPDQKPVVSPSGLRKIAIFDAALKSPLWPNLTRPTPEECQEVFDLLSSVHGVPQRPKQLVDSTSAAAGCGETPDVTDALIRTILSQNTTSGNSTLAKRSMDAHYGRANHRAVLSGTLSELQNVVKCGGLGVKKGEMIMGVLKTLDAREGGNGTLSMDYLRDLSNEDAMKELVSFDGVGFKTASCLLLLCLGRPSFAVDTHVLRITQSLGWIPKTASRDDAFWYLDSKIPNELKYPLHSLFVRHGRGCKKCSANGVTSMDFVDTCPIDHLVSRSRKPEKKQKSSSSAPSKPTPSKPLVKVKVEVETVTTSVAEPLNSRATRSSTRVTRLSTLMDAKPLVEGALHGLDG